MYIFELFLHCSRRVVWPTIAAFYGAATDAALVWG